MNLSDINFTCLKHNKAGEEKQKCSQFLETDVYVSEATQALRQLLVAYDQQNTAAASILLPQQAFIGCTSSACQYSNFITIIITTKVNTC